jgi:hypothetical protein
MRPPAGLPTYTYTVLLGMQIESWLVTADAAIGAGQQVVRRSEARVFTAVYRRAAMEQHGALYRCTLEHVRPGHFDIIVDAAARTRFRVGGGCTRADVVTSTASAGPSRIAAYRTKPSWIAEARFVLTLCTVVQTMYIAKRTVSGTFGTWPRIAHRHDYRNAYDAEVAIHRSAR